MKSRTGLSKSVLVLAIAAANVLEAQASLEEVIVTSTRKLETIQDVPISVTAFSNDAMYRKNITEINKLNSSVSGVNFTASGGGNNTVFSIRGRSRGVFGNALPAVNTYVNEVPLSTWGGNIPTYDMESLEVLKGPQGTLFGRNSTSGAILVETKRPDYDVGGYLTVKVGEYNSRVFEGAVDLPIIEDKLAVRVAGQIDERDGHTKDMLHPNEDYYGNHDRKNFRVSVLFEPTDTLSNLTTYEVNKIDEKGSPVVPVGFDLDNPFALVNNVPYYNGTEIYTPAPVPCNGNPACDAQVMQAQQEAAGVRKVWTDTSSFLDQELKSFGNITKWEPDAFTLKNVFGYREIFSNSVNDIDGSIFPLIGADNVVSTKQYTNELQISGDAFDGYLEYIGGLFWLKSEPDEGNRLALQVVAQTGVPYTAPYLGPAATPFNGAYGPSDFYTDTSKAAYGQISYDFSQLSAGLDGLSIDVGLRHTKDKSANCPVSGTSITTPIPTEDDCTSGYSAEFSKTTYNLGLNYQINPDNMVYVVSRTGYRAGGVNSPGLGGTLADYQEYQPETVQDIELGLKSDWELGGVIGRLNVALFHSDFEDVHYAVPTTSASQMLGAPGIDGDGDPTNDPTGGLFYSNAGESTVKGVEIDLTVAITEALEVSFNGSYIDKELTPEINLPSNWSGLPPGVIGTVEDIEAFVFLSAPDWSYNIGVEYTLPLDVQLGEVILSSNYFKISEIHYGGTIHADEYSTVDIRADWFGVLETDFDVAVYVTNLTDEEAIQGPSSSSASFGFSSAIYNDPRMWGASIRYSF